MVHGCMAYTKRAEMAARFHVTPAMSIQPNNAREFTTSVHIKIKKNALLKASHSFRITCDKSAVSLLESGEKRCIKITRK